MSESITIIADELFSIPEVLSPRLAWMRKHKIEAFQNGELWGESEGTWAATQTVGKILGLDACQWATGPTEDEAICNLARKLNLRLWNEPEPLRP